MEAPSTGDRPRQARRQVDLVWPVAALAGTQLVDAALCAVPAPFVTRCLDGVGFPTRYRLLIAPIKAAAGAGLLGGIVVPGLGALTGSALVAYFSIAVGMHVRAHDIGRNMTSARGLLVASGAATVCFVRGRPRGAGPDTWRRSGPRVAPHRRPPRPRTELIPTRGS